MHRKVLVQFWSEEIRLNKFLYSLTVGALVLGISRNPSLKDELFKMAILGFALTEAIALLYETTRVY
jgi:hypothetical protein